MGAYKRIAYIVGTILPLFGLVITYYGFQALNELKSLDANGVKVEGVVVEKKKNGIYRSPYVKFATLEGDSITFLSEFEINQDMYSYPVGKKVTVIYDKNDPQNARIDAFMERNFLHLFLIGFGVFLVLLGLFIRYYFLKKARKAAGK